MMSDCVYRIDGECRLVIRLYDQMGDTNYIGIMEIDVNEVNEYIQMEMNYRMED